MRAKLIEYTRYSRPFQESQLLENDGAIQRAGSQGGKDFKYDEFHSNVMRFGVRGSYWYLGSFVDWKTQADLFISIVTDDFHFLVCDFESTGNVLSRAFVASAVEFMRYLKSKGYKVILYTNRDIYNNWVAKYDGIRAAEFELWFSWPAPDSVLSILDSYVPLLPSGRKSCVIWQYMFGEHSPDGYEHDVFMGTKEDMYQWAAAGEIVPSPVSDEVPDFEAIPALPGPYWLLSDAEIFGDQTKAFDERFPGAKLDAYPATINMQEVWIEDAKLRFGTGIVKYSTSWLNSLKSKLTLLQWKWFWNENAGIHNRGDLGTVQQVTTAHNKVWVEKVDDQYAYISHYNNDENSVDLHTTIDPYRVHFVTVMGRTGNISTSGIFYPDLGHIPYPILAATKSHMLRIELKYIRSMLHLPMTVTVKTPNSRLNVRNLPTTVGSQVHTSFPDKTQIQIFELRKMSDGIWGRATSPNSLPGWVSLKYTDAMV